MYEQPNRDCLHKAKLLWQLVSSLGTVFVMNGVFLHRSLNTRPNYSRKTTALALLIVLMTDSKMEWGLDVSVL